MGIINKWTISDWSPAKLISKKKNMTGIVNLDKCRVSKLDQRTHITYIAMLQITKNNK